MQRVGLKPTKSMLPGVTCIRATPPLYSEASAGSDLDDTPAEEPSVTLLVLNKPCEGLLSLLA